MGSLIRINDQYQLGQTFADCHTTFTHLCIGTFILYWLENPPPRWKKQNTCGTKMWRYLPARWICKAGETLRWLLWPFQRPRTLYSLQVHHFHISNSCTYKQLVIIGFHIHWTLKSIQNDLYVFFRSECFSSGYFNYCVNQQLLPPGKKEELMELVDIAGRKK